MRGIPSRRLAAAAALAAMAATGSAALAADRFDDPFGYCAAVGTIDAPDQRYRGPAVPDAIARGLQRAMGAPNGPLGPFTHSFWRCMDGKVYACTAGANLPCQDKANTSRTPAPALRTFCRQDADAEVIPAYVTGHDTVYAWRCRTGAPAIERQVARVDPRGFIADIWHEIPRP